MIFATVPEMPKQKTQSNTTENLVKPTHTNAFFTLHARGGFFMTNELALSLTLYMFRFAERP